VAGEAIYGWKGGPRVKLHHLSLVFALVPVACAAVVEPISGGPDGSADHGSTSRSDAGPMHDGTVYPQDAETDVRARDASAHMDVRDAASVAYVCPGADAANQWSVSPRPSRAGVQGDYLNGVWGSGPNDVWAVGADVSSFGPTPTPNFTILHWDGSTWSVSPLPTFDGTLYQPQLESVWGSGPSDVWAVGGSFAGGGEILHWDGSAWSFSSVALSDGGTILPTVASVWGSGPSDVWAVGPGLVLHWDGFTWLVSSLPPLTDGGTLYNLGGVWGSGPNDVWAVGGDMTDGTSGTILHWNGSAWSTSPLPSIDGGAPPSRVTGIWGSGPNDVWGVNSEILHWNGAAWSVSASAMGGFALWGSGPSDVWAVGQNARGGETLHLDGSAWSVFPIPSVDGGAALASSGLLGIWGSGPCDVWAVGLGGTILHHP